MTPNIILNISPMNTMTKINNNNNDLELGEITIHTMNNVDPLQDSSFQGQDSQEFDEAFDAETASSGSEIWVGRYNDETSSTNSNSVRTGMSSTHPGSRQSRGEMSEESLQIAKKENLAVSCWRILMFGVLIIVTIVVGFEVFRVVRRNQQADFDKAFRIDTNKIYQSLGVSMDTSLEAVDTLATMMVADASSRNQTWPFTVMDHFALTAAKMRMLSEAIALQQYMYVEDHQRFEWEAFAKANEAWVQEAIEVERADTTLQLPGSIPDYDTNHSISIRYNAPLAYNATGPYTPTWQTYPMLPSGTTSAYNFDAIQHPLLGPGIKNVLFNHKVVIGPVLNYEDTKEEGEDNRVTVWARRHVAPDVDAREPIVRTLYPILDTAEGAITEDNNSSKVVGIIASGFFWRTFLENILPDEERGLIVIFQNTHNQSFTYEVNGANAIWLGPGDLHEPEFDLQGVNKTFKDIGVYSSHGTNSRTYGGLPLDFEFCAYSVAIFPSTEMKNSFINYEAYIYSAISVAIFVFTTSFLLCYDKLVTMRQKKVMMTAIKSTNIVSNLFPSNVRDRLLDENVNNVSNVGNSKTSMFEPTKNKLRSFLNDGEPSNESSKPIADLFPETTVLFADIAGFTAWSSTREPTQVFTLLETVYGAFDSIAARRGVFKVETIGDSYVAVTGLPDPRKDHAVVMAKFARDCRERFREMCSNLESTLGPETGDLRLRIGLHSGPVTAGVLRGQKSRFQLFGDTVNTAARMESTGRVDKIQVSQTTADLLRNAKKSHWLQAREEMVEAKGKGLMITFWVEPKTNAATSTCTGTDNLTNLSGSYTREINITPRISQKMERLINWNIDVLERLLRKIVARRMALKRKDAGVKWNKTSQKIVLDEVKEVIMLPEYDSKYVDLDADSITLLPRLRYQLREFVTAIALMYHDNPFHNFPHASHVGMSVAKLLSRIIAPDIDLEGHEELHDHTYGITSDPLTQFACVFAALIHDVDHPGVPNSQLVKEETVLAQIYENKSVAEQNSINLAWSMLLEDKYSLLRQTICKTQCEASRFRQLVVNAVCATDIMDKDLKAARNSRWEKAFSTTGKSLRLEDKEQINRKATIVIEHIIQASDVAHTMQHWHIYIKWNERLFAEMYRAYTQGRAEKDPTDTWYKGELGFFDFYIIPLAQKLSECGVFGVSSDEYLNYAIMNRNEWEKKGKDVVAGYVKKYKLDVLDMDTSAREHIDIP